MKSEFKFSHPSIDVYPNYDLFDIRLLDDKSRRALFTKKDVQPRELVEIFMKLLSTSSFHGSGFKMQHNKSKDLARSNIDEASTSTTTTSTTTSTKKKTKMKRESSSVKEENPSNHEAAFKAVDDARTKLVESRKEMEEVAADVKKARQEIEKTKSWLKNNPDPEKENKCSEAEEALNEHERDLEKKLEAVQKQELQIESLSREIQVYKKAGKHQEGDEAQVVKGKKMEDEADEGDVEEIRKLIISILKIESTINGYLEVTPEIIESINKKTEEIETAKARHKANNSGKTRKEVSEIEVALKELQRSLVEKKVQVSVQGRDLEGLMARLKKVAHKQLPTLKNEISEDKAALKMLTKDSSERKEIELKIENNKEILEFIKEHMEEENKKSSKAIKKWKVGDECCVSVKIKNLPDECEANIEDILLDSDISVQLYGYGHSLCVKPSQLRPSKGDKARDAQASAAIAYTITRMEKPSKFKEKQFTEEDFKMSPEDGKVALRNFLEILANMAKEATARKWQIVKKQIEGLIAGTVDPEAFSVRMHKEIITNPQPTLVPFTSKYLPHLQASLKSGEIDIDLVHSQNRAKTTPDSEPQAHRPPSYVEREEWMVGSKCRVFHMMTEYEAEIQDITPDDNGSKYARVKFTANGNEEVVKLDALLSYTGDGKEDLARSDDIKEEWKVGDKCRAVHLMTEYEAVIHEITFDGDGNKFAQIKFTGSSKEELLRLEELKASKEKDDQKVAKTKKQNSPNRQDNQPEESSSGKVSSHNESGKVPEKNGKSSSTPGTKYGFVWDPKMVKSNSKQASKAKKKKEPSTKALEGARTSKGLAENEGQSTCEEFERCLLCNYRYFSMRDLYRHFVDSHLRNKLTEYQEWIADHPDKCPTCFREFPQKQALLRHVVCDHNDFDKIVLKKLNVDLSKFNRTKFDQGTCQRVEKEESALAKGMGSMVTPDSPRVLANLRVADEIDLTCSVPSCELCGEDFTCTSQSNSVGEAEIDKSVHLVQHFRHYMRQEIHLEHPFDCPICPCENLDEEDLMLHYGLDHGIVFVFMQCELGPRWSLDNLESGININIKSAFHYDALLEPSNIEWKVGDKCLTHAKEVHKGEIVELRQAYSGTKYALVKVPRTGRDYLIAPKKLYPIDDESMLKMRDKIERRKKKTMETIKIMKKATGGCEKSLIDMRSKLSKSEEEDESRSETKFSFTVNKISKVKNPVVSPTFMVCNLPWNIMIMPKPAKEKPRTEENRSMGYYLQCSKESKAKSWSCQVKAELMVLSQEEGKPNFARKISHRFNSKENDWGFSNYMKWADVLDPNGGLIQDDSVTLELFMKANVPQGVYEFDCPKRYVATEGMVSIEHAFMTSNSFTREEYGCLRVGDNLVMFHINDFWVDAKNTALKKGRNVSQLGLKLGSPLVLHACRLGQEGQPGEVQYLATAVWNCDIEEFKDPDKRPKPRDPDKICKSLRGVFDMMSMIIIKNMTGQLYGKEKRGYRKALRMLKSKDDEKIAREVEKKEKQKEKLEETKIRNKERKVLKSKAEEPTRNIFKDNLVGAKAVDAAPLKLGEDKDWGKMKKLLEEIKTKAYKINAATDEAMDKCGFCFTEDFDLLRCGSCKIFTYCSEKCARQNKRIHEKECREAQREGIWNTALMTTRALMPPVKLWEDSGTKRVAEK